MSLLPQSWCWKEMFSGTDWWPAGQSKVWGGTCRQLWQLAAKANFAFWDLDYQPFCRKSLFPQMQARFDFLPQGNRTLG